MAIISDWNIDYTNKLISHIDGELDYDTGAGTQPAVSAVIRGSTTTALGKILSRTGTAASGTFTLTDVVGQFADNEALVWLDQVDFDNITNNGFSVGDTVTGATSGRTGVIRKIEYYGAGGTIYGDFGTGAWTNNENIQVSASTKALANGTGSDNTGAWTSALVNEATNGTITQPTVSVILNFDTGTIDFPRFAKVQNAATSPTKTGFIQKVYGVTATGSIRLVDVTGDWANDDPIYVSNKLPYDNVQSGKSFKIGDVVTGNSSAATGKILVDTGTKLILQNQSGTFTNDEQIHVDGVWIALVNAPSASDFSEQHALANGDDIKEQLAADGGIYNATSLNVVRDCNALYTYLQDTFDELGALDDQIPMSAQVKLQQYTLINSWRIPDLSFRFLESGSIQDSSLDNVWTNYQTIGTVDGIGDTAYFATTPLPRIYCVQSGRVLSPWWLPGHIDALVKVKTSTDPTVASTSTGQLINGGTVTIFCREFGSTYDHFETTTIAGVAPIPLATSSDLNNRTGTHQVEVSSASGFVVGEEIRNSTDKTKRGVVRVVNTSGTHYLQYVLTGTTQFANGNNITGQKSGTSTSASNTPTTLVAGYGSSIIVSTIDISISTSGITGEFDPGEQVSQASSGALGIFMGNSGNTLFIGNVSGTFNNTNVITGANSGATATANGAPSVISTVSKDIGDGNGSQPYNAVIFLDRTDALPQTLVKMYEWIKYKTRSLETAGEPPYSLIGGAGSATGVFGQIYTTLSSAYALVKASPLGTFAGGTFFGARGVFIQDMAAADIRNYQLIDANATLRLPPNQQLLAVNGLVSGDRVAVFRRPNGTAGSGILVNEYTVASYVGGDAFNGSGDTQLKVNTTITTDTPASGIVRVRNATTGLYESYNYTSFSADVFTLQSALGSNLTASENVYVPLIESQAASTSVSTNIIYVSNIPLLARVRKKGILPFEVEGTFSSTGASLTAIRTTDTIVD